MRDAMHEIGGAVDGIDDEAMALVLALDGAAFLAQEAIAGPRLGQFLDQDFFGALVGAGDEIAGPFIEIWRFSSSPKSRISGRPALRAAATLRSKRGLISHYSARRM